MKKILIFFSVFVFHSCFVARIDVNRHPDYNFRPTSPANITIYDGFLPTREFIIIGQMVITQTVLTDIKKSREEALKIVASMGGNAILISHRNIQWMRYNKAVKSGTANIYDYGYGYYGADWEETTTYYRQNLPIAKYYYIYILRWKDYIEPPPTMNQLKGQRIKAKVCTINYSKGGEVTLELETGEEITLRPVGASFEPGFRVGMEVDLVFFSINNIRIYYHHKGEIKERLFKKVQ